jgi:hypothetical protein
VHVVLNLQLLHSLFKRLYLNNPRHLISYIPLSQLASQLTAVQ